MERVSAVLLAYHTSPEDVMSPNGTHPRLKVKEPRSGCSEHRHAARLKCGLIHSSSGKKNALSTHKRGDKTLMRIYRQSGFFARRRMSPHLSLSACRCSLQPDRGSLTFRRGWGVLTDPCGVSRFKATNNYYASGAHHLGRSPLCMRHESLRRLPCARRQLTPSLNAS